METLYKCVDGKQVELSEVEKGHLKDDRERHESLMAQREKELQAKAERKSEILQKLNVTRDEWQLLLQGD